MFDWISSPEAWIALLTLTFLEIVLGIDNIIFISIQAGRLPAEQQGKARLIGLALAMFMRIGLLFSISWVMGLTRPLFDVFGTPATGRDLVLLGGGLFLIWKSVGEIHENIAGHSEESGSGAGGATFARTIVQILLLDIVFSLDSVITAVGMAKDIAVMVIAVMVSVIIMMVAAKSISDFVNRNPTVKMLAVSFLLLIGFTLTIDGLPITHEGQRLHIPKGYIYFAMGFAVFVEMLNLKVRGKSKHGGRLIQQKRTGGGGDAGAALP
jgi:predicted tellurium resistance membrane protein TerC